MADLEIPESAVRAAWVEYALITFETEQIDEPHIAAALAKAAPIIVENGLILGGPFGCGCHDHKTAHQLLIERDWLGPDQVAWLEQEGHAVWARMGWCRGRIADCSLT